MDFEQHGTFKLNVEKNILYVDAKGPFNDQFILKYSIAIEDHIRSLEHSDWSQIVVLHELSLYTPQAEQALIKSAIDRRKRGLVDIAFVLKDTKSTFLIQIQLSRCYSEGGVNHQFFDTQAQAKEWLNRSK
jgi:hypothetical protein